MEQVLETGTLYKAICENDWLAVKIFIEQYPSILEVEVGNALGETPVHIAAKFGREGIVKELLKLVSATYLEIFDPSGCTPLFIVATHSGSIPIARYLISKNKNALTIPFRGSSWMIPVSMAFRAGFNQMGRYLFSVTPPETFQLMGPTFLQSCFIAGELDIVLALLRRCKELLFAPINNMGSATVLELIATFLPMSPNRSQLFFWERCLYDQKDIKIPSATTTDEVFYVDIQEQEGANDKDREGLLHWITSCAYDFLGAKNIKKIKLQHELSEEILNLLCGELQCMNRERKILIEDTLMRTLNIGNEEFVMRVVKANPELVSLLTLGCDKGGPQLFFHAVAFRRAKLFNMLCDFRFRHIVTSSIDEDGNNLLHVASKLAPSSYLSHITSPALQMQREMQWFKAVESIMQPGLRSIANKSDLTPMDFFKKNHEELRSQGEEWMKATASSYSVVAALVFTIMFSAMMSLPGGYNESGFPRLLKEKLFILFLSSDALSLLFSITSVLTFLEILTSHFEDEEFLYSLPKKLIIGISSLFVSVANLVITFSATIAIMLRASSLVLWAIIPFIFLALIPITVFALLQFPLLVKVIYSTYGPGIVNKKKKMKMWP